MEIGKRFYYRASDRRLLVVLTLLAAVCIALIVLAGGDGSNDGSPSPADSAGTLAQRRAYNVGNGLQGAKAKEYYNAGRGRKAELFPFDPNTADSTALLRLGLQPWQVRNIYKYRANGGIYSHPSDFAKLYGLTVKQYRELRPYIRISPDYLPAATLAEHDKPMRDTLLYPLKLKETERMSLNTTDTAALKRVPGIGSYFARTIVRYGERLGGYVSVDQLDEIEGFPPEAKRYFYVNDPQPKRLNVNTMTLSQLRRHPYIGYYRARTITEYRRLHGRINSLDDLRFDRDFNPEAIARLSPYVEF